MALIVETGAGLADAESYASVTTFKAYCDKSGRAHAGYEDAAIEQALRRATQWLDARYSARFTGQWSKTAQRLEWPRAFVPWRDTFIASDVIPEQIVAATCEAAYREVVEPHSLSPDEPAARVKRDKVGDVETEFALSSPGASIVLRVIDDLLYGLTKGRAAAYFGKAVRG